MPGQVARRCGGASVGANSWGHPSVQQIYDQVKADAHRYRLGVKYEALPINRRHVAEVNNYQRDGLMRFDGNAGTAVNYEPKTFGGPVADPAYREPPLKISGDADKYDQERGEEVVLDQLPVTVTNGDLLAIHQEVTALNELQWSSTTSGRAASTWASRAAPSATSPTTSNPG